MANVVAGHRELVVELDVWEAAVCLRRGLHRPLEEVQLVRVDEDPFAAGCPRWVAPGLLIPGRLAVGTVHARQGKELVALRTGCPALVVDLDGPWQRIRVSHRQAGDLAQDMAELLLARRPSPRSKGPGVSF